MNTTIPPDACAIGAVACPRRRKRELRFQVRLICVDPAVVRCRQPGCAPDMNAWREGPVSFDEIASRRPRR